MFNKNHEKARVLPGELEENYSEALDSPEHQFKDAAKEYTSQATNAVCNSAKNIKNRIESNPVKCVAVAVVSGLIIGFLLGRK